MIGGQGIPLPYPQALFPALPQNQPFGPLGTPISLAPAAQFYVPAGWFQVTLSAHSLLQWLDPITQNWIPFTSSTRQTMLVNSDGGNFRVINPTGCPIGALVTNVGTNYVQASTTVALSVGNSTWRAIVGGACSQTVTVGNDSAGNAGGTNFSIAPIVDYPAPPQGGVQATAIAAITAGAVSSVTVLNQGAGYLAAPVPILRPNPFDPAIGTITVPALTTTLATAGGIAAILCTGQGRALTGSEMASATLAISGVGASATAGPVFAMAVQSVALSNSGGVAYPGSAVDIQTLGGKVITAAGAIINPQIGPDIVPVRRAIMSAPVSAGAAGTVEIDDAGLFQTAPVAIVTAQASASAQLPTTATAATLTMGGVNTTIYLQQMPWS